MTESKEGRIAFHNGDDYYFGQNGREKNIVKAVEWYRIAAENGIPEAQSYMGYFCKNGEGVPQDISSAIQWYRMAAKNDYLDAIWALHNMYENGDGVPADPNEAFRYLLMAADRGDPDARFNIAVRNYCDGQCSKDSLIRVIAAMEELDEQKYVKASYWLGVKYYYGVHFADLQDRRKGIYYLQRAKNLGHADAACILGEACLSGAGIEKDAGKALEYFYFAYDYGSETTSVLFDLGVCFFEGTGTEQDCMLGSVLFARYLEILGPDDERAASAKDMLDSYRKKYGPSVFQSGSPAAGTEILNRLNGAIQSNSPESWKSLYRWLNGIRGCSEKYAALGYLYGETGCVDMRDLRKSYACFRKSVCYDMQNAFAQRWLGWYYENGIATEKDINRAYDAYVLSNQLEPNDWTKARIEALLQ